MILVCIPAYNEEKTISEMVKKSSQYADIVIVCDDGSTDDTAKLAKDAGAHVISHKKNQGYGSAIITLFEQARTNNADIMITIDGDGQHDPDQIPILADTLTQHKVDVVVGSRFLDKHTDTPGYRQRGIKIITSAANYGTNLGISDAQSGFRAYSRNAIDAIHPTEEGMSVSTEILLKVSNKGLSLAEVPITVSYNGSTSKHHPLSHGVSVLMGTLKYVSVKHPILFYGVPGLALMVIGAVIGYQFLDAYLHRQAVFLGSLAASIILFIVGTILCVTSVILFTMATLIREKY